ncbi:hypothetical protein HELRODRAFT_193918 [Helobdella robusta]|uniref:MIF4G domain-containing protein n=1 Tax=Helobdella robusta TaxID=6412 RepID=T1FVH1_HELRO|nr:hypothetical protein HELRODRAFT_193918 [Helobdella robusta]ESN93905.1 hypothetical protein HELRODRAFT_193918 [Helobdella robusta]
MDRQLKELEQLGEVQEDAHGKLDYANEDASFVALAPSDNNAAASLSLSLVVGDNTTKSKALSADAPEFYPKNFILELPVGLDPLTLNDDDRHQNSPHSTLAGMTLEQLKQNELILRDLRQGIQMFTNDPGNFEQFMPFLARKLAALISAGDHSFMSVIEEIFTQSIEEVNFRYTGARMCNYLSHSEERAFDDFQRLFLARCEQEYDEILSPRPTSLAHIIGYSLFVGELLLNMKDVSTNEVIPQFSNQIGNLLMYLLNDHSKEALMCCVQLLKLTGAVLEESLPSLNDIFNKMNTIVNEQSLPQNLLCLMQSVMNQRLNNWGQQQQQQQSQHSTEPFIGAGAGDSFDSPVDDENPINLTGNELYNDSSFSSDEREMASLMEECNERGSSLADQYWIGDQKMDNETATAFEQFMQESEIVAMNLQQQPQQLQQQPYHYQHQHDQQHRDNYSYDYNNHCSSSSSSSGRGGNFEASASSVSGSSSSGGNFIDRTSLNNNNADVSADYYHNYYNNNVNNVVAYDYNNSRLSRSNHYNGYNTRYNNSRGYDNDYDASGHHHLHQHYYHSQQQQQQQRYHYGSSSNHYHNNNNNYQRFNNNNSNVNSSSDNSNSNNIDDSGCSRFDGQHYN